MLCFVLVKKDIQDGDEEGVKDKETAIIELGTLLASTQQADGNINMPFTYLTASLDTFIRINKLKHIFNLFGNHQS